MAADAIIHDLDFYIPQPNDRQPLQARPLHGDGIDVAIAPGSHTRLSADTSRLPAARMGSALLAAHGHGPEWAQVFHISSDDAQRAWSAIAQTVPGVPIASIRDAGSYGVSCEVRIVLVIGIRTAPVLSAWHYAQQGDAPRLVTAFPTP